MKKRGNTLFPPGLTTVLRSPALLRFALLTVFSAVLFMESGSRAVAQGPPTAVKRTVPQAHPPKVALHFSAKPTPQEISRARVFEEPLVPVGGKPGAEENSALAAALLGYAKRSGPDDFSSLTTFLEQHPQSPWRAALLTDLGLEYYNTAHYSLALGAWKEAWPLAKDATDRKAKAIADRAGGELAAMYARLGRIKELDALLKSVAGREFVGAATERITGAREGLWNMQHKPEVSFKCGPYALESILLSDQRLLASAPTNAMMEIFNFPSTQRGCSLPQVAELSKKVGLNYHMAFREKGGAFIVPSVVNWKVGHYAAMVRQVGGKYLLEDPTFGNTEWATRQALEAETSGYFLVPPGELPRGWRSVDAEEGASVWGKGFVSGNDPGPTGPCDLSTGGSSCVATGCGPFGGGPAPSAGGPGPVPAGSGPPSSGMAVSRVHLMTVNLNIIDTPVGYAPPVGFPVRFTVRYNQRDAFQPANFTYSNFGPKWTCDWISYITDNPSNTLADVNYYIMGGGTRTFTSFNTNTQTFAFQQYDQTQLKRTGVASYEMLAGDGSKAIFSQSDGSIGTSRKIFLTQLLDPFGNAVTLTYDGNLRIVAITDAIGQVTTLTYGDTNDIYRITRVTDPFTRFASFEYDSLGRLTNITDVIGLMSTFTYEGSGDFINSLITPYGTNTFFQTTSGDTTRALETVYADGSRDRVEFNQYQNIPEEPAYLVPDMIAGGGGSVRNSFYWSRTACATAYGDYTKARIYHWLHSGGGLASGCLESMKEPLENRVYFNYEMRHTGVILGSTQPTQIGRVLDDGQSQIYTYAYNGFGHVTNSIDPVGRTFSYLYASNGIDLLEIHQTRQGNELLFRATYNAQHQPLTIVGADGQTNAFTYNSRGQLLTETNPKGETTTYAYDTNGYLVAVDGALPGTNDTVTATYDMLGRMQTKTDVSGYTVTFEHDDMDRLTKITHPDGTFEQITYDRLDPVVVQDRAGRQTLFEYDNVRQMKKKTDPMGRVTLFEWCRCGAIKSLTDPMGRVTSWLTDVQSRPVAKQYGDGSQVRYIYENTTSRMRQVIDEKQQITQFTYNRDNALKSIAYADTAVPTPGVSFTYDPNYGRRVSMTDGAGTTLYSYYPITATPALGANQLASVDGPLANDTITYSYDELGRRVSTAVNGVASLVVYDSAGRVVSETNALGTFSYTYDGSSARLLSLTFPNGQTEERAYGDVLHDFELARITHKFGATPISEFLYDRDIPANRITTWSQQAGSSAPDAYAFAYDDADQLLSATVTNTGALVSSFSYSYDPAGNRLTEQIGLSNYSATFNALNQVSTSTAPGASRTNEWDAKDRLVAVNAGNQRTEFAYDGMDRMVSIRQLTNGVEASFRRLVWCDNDICEERDAAGAVTKRYYPGGMKVESGPAAGSYFYTRDHLGSVRELVDSSGDVRARYAYDPFGRRTKLSGDLEADFGFTGLFYAGEAQLFIARFRACDPELGRWLSRDPIRKPELTQGPNLYAYVANDPINLVDPLGLECCKFDRELLDGYRKLCAKALTRAAQACALATQKTPEIATAKCAEEHEQAYRTCKIGGEFVKEQADKYVNCMVKKGCPLDQDDSCPKPDPKPRCGNFELFVEFSLSVPGKLGFYAAGGGYGGGHCRP